MEFKKAFKLSTIFLLATAPALVLAQGQSITPCSFCGWTIGAGLGVTTFMSDMKSTSSVSSDIINEPIDDGIFIQPAELDHNYSVATHANANVYRYNAMGNLFVGYGRVFPNYIYLGSELGMNIFGANETELPHSVSTANFASDNGTVVFNVNKSLNSKTKVERNSVEPFLDIKFGFLTTPTAMVYLRGGINYNDIKLKQQSTFQATGSGFDIFLTQPPLDEVSTNYTITNKDSRSAIGYRLGAGTEFLVTPSMGIGFDYVYSFYPKVKSTVSGTGTDVACYFLEGCVATPGIYSAESKATVSDQEVMAKLIYHFG